MKKIRGINNLPDIAFYDQLDTPVGKLTIITSKKGLHAILWEKDRENTHYVNLLHTLRQDSHETTIKKTKHQLKEYFSGKRKIFDLPLVFNGTDFQNQAWQQLLKIPYGKTISYGEQAKKLGDKNKARAVGLANGLNPISIIVPCHRVIGSNGKLTGFGGGLDIKEKLLNLESQETPNEANK